LTIRHSILAVLVLGVSLTTEVNSAKAQDAPKAKPETKVLLQVVGHVTQPLSLSEEQLAKLPRQSVRAKSHDGVESQFEGVPLIEILAKAGVATGQALRGPAMAQYVVVEAADGYRATFALAELDSTFTDRVILLADHRDGKPLAAQSGPLQIIVPGEKKHARWVRQVITLKVGRG
jgi:DMSO/TMAO reductase YedYZ molybdopterin-dependent catalytic subunit